MRKRTASTPTTGKVLCSLYDMILGRAQFLQPELLACETVPPPSILTDILTDSVRTTKYTWYNFLPKNLFEQFHRLANVYFLFIVILNWIPAINAFGKEIAMLPLMFVLTVTAVKDAYEDKSVPSSHRASTVYRTHTRPN